MISYPMLGLVLLAMTFGGVPAAAQETGAAPLPDTTAMALVFVVFPGEDAAGATMSSLDQSQTAAGGPMESYAVVSRDKQGKLTVQDIPRKSESGSRTDAKSDDMIDGVVALLGQPRGQGQADTAAGQAGTTGISSANIDKMQRMLAPETSAIIAVVPEPQTQAVTSELDQADATNSGEVVIVEMAPPE